MSKLLRQYFVGLLAGLCLGSATATTFPLPSPDTGVVGNVQVIFAQRADTLLDIARIYDLGYNEIIAANPGVDPWLPGEHTRIIVPTQFVLPDAPREGIVLNLAAMRLYYFPSPRPGEQPVVMTYPIGIGRLNWETPLGVTKIVARIVDPVWHAPASILEERAKEGITLPATIAAGPDNPLGQYALKLALPGYLIHGTNKPYGIGRRVSHGCVRLYPEDIAELFKAVAVNTPVRFVDQPYLAGWLDARLYLQAHRPLAEDRKAHAHNLTPVVRAIMKQTQDNRVPIDWDKAIETAEQARSLPVAISSAAAAPPDAR